MFQKANLELRKKITTQNNIKLKAVTWLESKMDFVAAKPLILSGNI